MRRWLVPTLLLFACVVTGCSYDQVEPGLFGRSITRETTAPPIRPVTPEETLPTPNPDLPVVGEAIWTSADGLDITMRLAVHPVRRVEGATVLDWSVTPLHGAGLRRRIRYRQLPIWGSAGRAKAIPTSSLSMPPEPGSIGR
jgi:hypothetical protein